MIPYYDELSVQEQQEVTEMIQLLYRQTFILERKFDKKAERFQYSREFRVCNKHLEFLKEYFAISGIEVVENSQMGIIYIQGGNVVGEKLPKLATLYLLALKLIYDEQMATVSTSIQIYTSLSEIHERLGTYRLLKKQPSPTDIRRSIALLKKYQVIEAMDLLDDLDGQSRMMIYPCINVVLFGSDVRSLLESFAEGEEQDDESEI